jgi:Concanavalin A-like lectin/glucanases superfamily
MKPRFKSGTVPDLRTMTVVALVILAGLAAWETAPPRYPQKSAECHLCPSRSASPPPGVTDRYDRQVLSLDPVLYLTLGHPSSPTEADLSGNGHTATYFPAHDAPAPATLPNGDTAAQFNGRGQYAQVPSSGGLSVTGSGCLTAEAWIRPATLQFSHEQGSGYVYILGKGTPDKQEYALRMYSASNSEVPERPNRISAYAFNLAGGTGSGAYFQDKIVVGGWIMIAFVMDDRPSPGWPAGYVAIYKDGELRSRVSLSQFGVRPKASSAPFRIGTRDLESYFSGAIGKVAVYDYVLSARDIAATYQSMLAHRA